ncbi:MAG: hypothetical protein HQL22_02505 [Candidatus Omnitrophica bacterium]|nr:hypothetical protein [Candidatus Omnitrophota bacterium]
MSSRDQYELQDNGSFVIRDYHQAKPFCNFFPGIAGMWGVPMWVFTTNRGQGIASFGIESKDKAILEFQPANKAYQLTATRGFRTFLKVKRSSGLKFYEPFRSPAAQPFKIEQRMIITSHDLTIEEENKTLGLKVTVNYFTMPEEPFTALVRRVKIDNLSKAPVSIEMLDGIPAITPFGQNDWVMKNMCRTIEAWYKVRNTEKKAPYFQLSVEAADTPQVKHIKEGNFYFAFDPQSRAGQLLDPVVEAGLVFGQAMDFICPENFFGGAGDFRLPAVQQTDNRTPCAMTFMKTSLKSGAAKEIVSLTGFSRSIEELNVNVRKVTAKGFISEKAKRNRLIIEEIKSMSFTHGSSAAFNAYAGQTFLDNVMRGGLPITLETSEGPAVFNVYSRKHGDPERDYNFFRLSPTFLSQGNGNYRDVNQNRRNDVWFNPDLKDNSIINFFSLSQADGYNPLVVCGMAFIAEEDEKIDQLLGRCIKSGDTAALKTFLKKGFMPGDLFAFIADNGIRLTGTPKALLMSLLGICQKFETAQHGEGFWVDHWTYNFDLVESYLSLYPENLRQIFLENREFSFYHNAVYVRPRDERYVLTSRGVRQYDSLHEGKEDKDIGHKLRIRHGQGEVYRTNLLVKMLCLIANKAATFDPSGIGIDMEANKPGWYDSLNGLPGLLGSSICESLELKRLALFVRNSFDKLGLDESMSVQVFEELALFVDELNGIFGATLGDLDYWKKANTIKEEYRARVRTGISGVEKGLMLGDISRFLDAVIGKVDAGLEKARASGGRNDGLFATYFYHKVVRYESVEGVLPAKEGPHVRPIQFERYDMPLFLEGFVHALRCEEDAVINLALHQRVKKSALYDKGLGMYKLNADITKETEEIGRTRVFPRGWLENESIWLHMEYKYLMELLRCGLYEEFYQALKTCCIPFMSPDKYGRSILENSSFIVSSAHPDKNIHGQGFVARLSGSTAEFIHLWMYMNAGVAPFSLTDKNDIELAFCPALAGWLFTQQKTSAEYVVGGKAVRLSFPAGVFAFMFMGRTLVVYHNPARKDTFGEKRVRIIRSVLAYSGRKKIVNVDGSVIPSPLANDVRAGNVARIDIYWE